MALWEGNPMPLRPDIFYKVFVVLVVLLQSMAAAATILHDGPATPEQLSLFIPSSLPPEAMATVRYRKVGSSTWIVGHPLHRIRPGFADSRMTVEDGFAWPMIGLTPGTSYEVEVTITHGAQRTVDTGGMTTRALPAAAGAPTKIISAGATSAQIQAILDNVVPGDVVHIAAGVYSVDNILLRRSGTVFQPIYVRGESRGKVVLRDGAGAILNLLNASDLVVENLTLEGSGVDSGIAASSTGITFDNSYIPERVTIRNTTIKGVDRGIDVTGEARQVLVYNNTLIGNNQWNQDLFPYDGKGSPGSGDGKPDIDQNVFWNDDGIRITGQGNAAFNNTLSGFGDALAVENGYKSIGVHFYRNDIRVAGDDAIEGDYGYRNITFYDNRVQNAMTLVSLDPIWGGPFLAARNIGINIGRGPYKLLKNNTGYFFYNNTVVRTNNQKLRWGWKISDDGDQKAWGYRNNILIYRGSGDLLAIVARGENPIDFTHNSWYPDKQVWWSVSEGLFENLSAAFRSLGVTTPVFSGSAKRHEADNISEDDPFVTSIDLGPDYHTRVSILYSPYLLSGTAPKNSGAIIPNITDGFSGDAPDRGALISGVPTPIWGDGSEAEPHHEAQRRPKLRVENEVDHEQETFRAFELRGTVPFPWM
jgi:hypothetical protein